ncbi:XRE family transcriptional regulator [bacterium]|nr:XRE family transcriptional regulator [bacterium]
MNRKVKSILIRRGIKQTEIAEELGLRRCTVSAVINGHTDSRRVKEYIAKRLNMDFEKLWGKAA